MSRKLKQELTELLNRHSRESASNTPDFALANFMLSVLEAGEELIRTREVWHDSSYRLDKLTLPKVGKKGTKRESKRFSKKA